MLSGEIAWYRKCKPLTSNSLWEMTIIFDPETGETHFLSDLPALLLEHIDQSPQTLKQLAGSIDALDDLSDEARKQIRRALDLLEANELIESAPSLA